MSDREFIAPTHLKVGMHDFTPSMGVDPIERVADHLAASAARTRRLEREHDTMRRTLRMLHAEGAIDVDHCGIGVAQYQDGWTHHELREADAATLTEILNADE